MTLYPLDQLIIGVFQPYMEIQHNCSCWKYSSYHIRFTIVFFFFFFRFYIFQYYFKPRQSGVRSNRSTHGKPFNHSQTNKKKKKTFTASHVILAGIDSKVVRDPAVKIQSFLTSLIHERVKYVQILNSGARSAAW